MATTAEDLRMVDLRTAAGILGFHERTVRRAIAAKGRERLVAAKIRGEWRIKLADLKAYQDAHTTRRT